MVGDDGWRWWNALATSAREVEPFVSGNCTRPTATADLRAQPSGQRSAEQATEVWLCIGGVVRGEQHRTAPRAQSQPALGVAGARHSRLRRANTSEPEAVPACLLARDA